MGKKQLKTLLILLVVVGAVAAALTMMQSGKVEKVKSFTDREDLFADFPINEVAEVGIVAAEGSVNLKQGEKGWTVAERDGYPANGDKITDLLRMVWGLKIVQNVEVGESQYGRLNLLPPGEGKEGTQTGGQVEKTVYFKGKDGKTLRTLYLGKTYERMENRPSPFGGGPSMSEVGRYVKVEGEDGVFLVGETFADTDLDPAKWLDENFFKVENIKAIEIKSGKKEDDWKLTRTKSDGEFVLADAGKDEDYDPMRANAMKNAFAGTRFEDVVVGEMAKNKPGKTTFIIDTFAGFHYVIKISDKNDLNEYHLTVDVDAKFDEKRAPVEGESEEDKKKNDEEFVKAVNAQKEKLAFEKTLVGKVFKVRSYVVDSVNKKRADLMKLDEAKAGGGMPGGAPGAGGLPPGMQLPPGMKLPGGVEMPAGHPPVKKAPAPEQKPGDKENPDKPAKAEAGKPEAEKAADKPAKADMGKPEDKENPDKPAKVEAGKPEAEKAADKPAKAAKPGLEVGGGKKEVVAEPEKKAREERKQPPADGKKEAGEAGDKAGEPKAADPNAKEKATGQAE
jgi:hypothetical protein